MILKDFGKAPLGDKAKVVGTGVAIFALGLSAYIAFGPSSVASQKGSSPSKPTSIKQKSTGRNSPNIGGNARDVTIVDNSRTEGRPDPVDSPVPRKASKGRIAAMRIEGDWRAVLNPKLNVGDRIRITATGRVQWGLLNQTSGPERVALGAYSSVPPPIPDKSRIGALIGRFGNDKPFIIGEQKELTVKPGDLSLGVNDGYTSNNKLGFVVSI